MNQCADRDTLLTLLAGQGTVATVVRSHVDGCALCREAMGRLLGVFYVAAADVAFRSGQSLGDACDHLSDDELQAIFKSVDIAYRQRFESSVEDDRARLDELGRMVDLATTSMAPLDTLSAMPSGLADTIFQNVDREYQHRFADTPPVVQKTRAERTVWSRPVRWATAAVLLIATGVGVLTSVDYFSNNGNPVVVGPQPKTRLLAEDKTGQHKQSKQDEPVETPAAAIDIQDLQRLAAQRRQRFESAQRQGLAFLRQRLSEGVAVMHRLSSLGDDWRRYPDDTLLRARRAILEQDYELADFWLQKRLLAIDLGVISEPRVPVLLARLECRRRQIDLEKSEIPAEQFESLMEIYVELVQQINHPRPALREKAGTYRDRLHGEAVQIAHLASGAQRPAEVVTLLWPWRETLDIDARGMLVTARRDINHQFDRLVGTGQLAATRKVESWIRSRYLQISAVVEPGS